ncbi:MAG: aminotransferase class I/II-fold pyridoxal phosphate-dependent enzyme [Elusimicrobia bacterium]|nr:aminotransferase class I/II-fold pyridoxal phosphate-dependent enzyme [Elusimicrobiota bacterium]
MRTSARARAAAGSETLRLSAEAARLRRAGRDIVSLLEGEPDLPVPAAALGATVRALKAGKTGYSDSAGLPELRSAIARKLRARNGVPAVPEGVLVTNGAKQAVYAALQTLAGPGDEVIVPRPGWVSYPEAVRLAGARPVFAGLAGVAAAVTARTRAVVINTPNNPTGAVASASELKALVRLAERKDLVLVSDEAYEDLVYDGVKHVSAASLGPAAARRTLTVQTFSKSWSMTGYRVGFLAGPVELVSAAARMHGHMTGNVCTFAQHGALAALALPPAQRERRRAVYERRRDLACALAAPLFDFTMPEGALFILADARRWLGGRFKDDAALAGHLLRAGVAVVPGSAFGAPGHLRLSFCAPEARLSEGFRRLREALCR